MNIVETISLPKELKTKIINDLMCLIGGNDTRPKSMYVGGCVRNILMRCAISDIDIATQHLPEVVIEKLQNKNIKVIPTGIKHGTVTAVVSGASFEITTLRRDDETDGRHAKVSFTDDWTQDAHRRDFTMNALFADLEGNIYDPTGKGLTDLKAGRVVFVGNSEERIAEDYLRILRFFRFHAYYGQGQMDGDALKACQKAAKHIASLSRERITQEFLKILQSARAVPVLSTMFAHQILDDLKSNDYQSEVLENIIELQAEHGANNVMTRLFILAGCQAKIYEEYLRLSHAQQNFLIKLEMVMKSVVYDDLKSLKRAIYYHGNDLLLQGYLLAVSMSKVDLDKALLKTIQSWQAPKFPLSGKDLMEEGYQTGPELGAELKHREEEWLEEVIS